VFTLLVLQSLRTLPALDASAAQRRWAWLFRLCGFGALVAVWLVQALPMAMGLFEATDADAPLAQANVQPLEAQLADIWMQQQRAAAREDEGAAIVRGATSWSASAAPTNWMTPAGRSCRSASGPARSSRVAACSSGSRRSRPRSRPAAAWSRRRPRSR
jgi:hypothetical protein